MTITMISLLSPSSLRFAATLSLCLPLNTHVASAFLQQQSPTVLTGGIVPTPASEFGTTTQLHEMKRPILDRLASFVFQLENDRIAKSTVVDSKGRSGEPMEWAEENSIANQFTKVVSSNELGYRFKQGIADLVAGEYDEGAVRAKIAGFVDSNPVALYSFTTCPFCRKAKDFLDEKKIPYTAVELDLLPGNEGNEIRSVLGKMTRRTSVPCIFIGGECIGGCNDGPGLLPLAREDGGKKLNQRLQQAGVSRG
mmetsp:Transcript_14910/g.31291  ORF Transcript_14910/g.31291 Transcript_14910/m.31291 type:complete len:253 (+) Transcript_14910:297-1055(+)